MSSSQQPLTKDELVALVEEALHKAPEVPQTQENLIHDVVAEYIFRLMNRGNIPEQFLDDLERDLKEEAIDIYRKKTYGYYSLFEYRKYRFKK